MPLSSTDLTTLKSKIDDVAAFAGGLVPDPTVNPLQAQLDAAVAARDANAAARDQALADKAAMQTKIDAAKAALQAAAAADLVEDARHADALNALG